MCVGLDGPDKTAILLGEIVTNFGLLPVGEVIRLLRGGETGTGTRSTHAGNHIIILENNVSVNCAWPMYARVCG